MRPIEKSKIPLRRRLVIVVAAVMSCHLNGLMSQTSGCVFAAELSASQKAAVDKGMALMKKQFPAAAASPYGVLYAYAMLKAGYPATSPEISGVLDAIKKRCAGVTYRPTEHHFYTVGLEMLLLSEIDPTGQPEEMRKMLDYVVKGQLDNGAWFYPDQNGAGDVSITQYAMLGLWAAERSGLPVPKATWDRAASWHLKVQAGSGQFAYHPRSSNPNTAELRTTMTAAGACNLMLARMHLFPETQNDQAPSGDSETRFGVLTKIDASRGPETEEAASQERVSVTPAELQQAASRAITWTANNYQPGRSGTSYDLYYLYTVERMAAIANLPMFGQQDWHGQGSQWLVKTQQATGNWPQEASGEASPAAFGVLFLVRATGKMLGRLEEGLGGGLLAGGRGLPSDLNAMSVGSEGVKKTEIDGPLDELLARLENPASTDVPAVQQAVLDAVRFGDREKLIGQRDRLRGLVTHPEPEVRRTAFWALGRGGKLADAALLVKGLKDPDAATAIEAHNALCVLTLRPNAFGISDDPWSKVPEGAGDAAREAAFTAWQQNAFKAWNEWYQKMAPYEERDGLGLLR